ncbi:MAG: RNase A-like domain-containing protein, partial [Roseiarcus sp.]
SAFVSQVNRATSETLRMQATQEGLVPLKAWVKGALDHVIQVYLNQPDLEFVWVGDDAVDPLQQAQTLNILVGAGIKTREEARADLGLAPQGGKAGAGGLGKFNPYHDPSNGQFTSAEGAGIAPTLVAANKPVDRYSVVLSEEESKGDGHAIGDHVGKTASDLIEFLESTKREVQTDGGTLISMRERQGSFLSEEAANDLVNRVLQNHKEEVDLVASGRFDQQWLEDRIGSKTGIEAISDDFLNIRIRPTYNVGVNIVHDPTSWRGYRVQTAYPLND